jgi:hypothetical protein
MKRKFLTADCADGADETDGVSIIRIRDIGVIGGRFLEIPGLVLCGKLATIRHEYRTIAA